MLEGDELVPALAAATAWVVGPEEEGWVLAHDIQREFDGRRLNVEVPYHDADGAGRTVKVSLAAAPVASQTTSAVSLRGPLRATGTPAQSQVDRRGTPGSARCG
jgi:hypothetical protein